MTFIPQEKKERFHDLITFVSVKPIVKMARGVEKPGIEITYLIGDGSKHKGAPWTKNAFADSLKGCRNVLTSLREGDLATLELTVNGDYKNLAGIISGHIDNPNKIPFGGAAKTSFTGGNQGVARVAKTDYNERAAKGQALNLAMNFALAEGRGDEDAYILSLLPRMLALGEAAQNGSTQLQTTQQPVTTLTQPQVVQAAPQTRTAIVSPQQSSTASEPGIQQGELDDTLDNLFGGI